MTAGTAPVMGPEGPIRPAVDGAGPRPLRAVLFDFSGTLFQVASYADRIRAASQVPVPDEELEALLDGLEAGLDDPDVAAAQHARDVSAEAHRHAFLTWYASVPALAPFAGALYEQLRTPAHWLPYADARPVLEELAARGVPMGVVSDVGWDLRPTFAAHGLDGFFTAWVHSCDHATEKPDPYLFRHACGLLGVGPEETLMVGDNPAKDGGAVGAGLRAYVLPVAAGGTAPGSRRGLDAVPRLLG
ncbi:HAD-IA family hydrolase [Streptomyces sp. HNM0574]|uniref:HAD family hydrolase n=1 Tax=Streptomyces sp. HNM0574 TaxID=2714954 RepID=UPI00146E6BE5|nr:HAD-IA family hydrolase [Streptomyces sp. HNM0574]NLU66084.1 HAD-IA family hydrolase [Streptomyces sp. HNM0574]